jgi:hypothetical protein
MKPIRLTSLVLLALYSCNPIDEFNQKAELQSLEDGFKTSAALSYCVSIASRVFTGEPIPNNVTFNSTTTNGYSGSGIIHIQATDDSPVPFNEHIGDITIAGLWDGDGGVISVVFSNLNLKSGVFKFYGVHTIPLIVRPDTDEIVSIFAQQDIILGEGSDTILSLNLSRPKFDMEMERLNTSEPSETFVAIKQNVWHLTIDYQPGQDVYDDRYRFSGGGQIAEAKSDGGGVLYHAMINANCEYNECELNPISGTAFIQNIKAGTTIDLGTLLIDFHSDCNGLAETKVATGKYSLLNKKDISLQWR